MDITLNTNDALLMIYPFLSVLLLTLQRAFSEVCRKVLEDSSELFLVIRGEHLVLLQIVDYFCMIRSHVLEECLLEFRYLINGYILEVIVDYGKDYDDLVFNAER